MRVKYIGKRDTLAFERGKVYEVMSVEKGWFRIMTELDEDYLFPPHIFEIVEDDTELSAVAAVFENLLDDVQLS